MTKLLQLSNGNKILAFSKIIKLQLKINQKKIKYNKIQVMMNNNKNKTMKDKILMIINLEVKTQFQTLLRRIINGTKFINKKIKKK